ncbi:MAG: periplasmic heavy metal sensor [Bacteroidetes bacterium]|nr:periplasmic heavy metal sensor [Bacteroidota bacterium]
MKFSTNKINLVVVLLITLNALTLGSLWYTLLSKPDFPPPPPQDKQGGILGLFERELDLNEEQLKEFRIIRDKHFASTRVLVDDQREWKRIILEEAFRFNSDNNLADSLSNLIGENQSELEIAIYNHFLEMKALCNDAQKEKLAKLILEMAESGEQGPPPNREMPPPPRNGEPSKR